MSVSFMFIACIFIVPLIMIICGFLWKKGGPKKINSIYGFRTYRSKADRDSWDFAHLHNGRYMLKAGTILLCIGVITAVLGVLFSFSVIGCFLASLLSMFGQMIVLTIGIVRTERALEERQNTNK